MRLCLSLTRQKLPAGAELDPGAGVGAVFVLHGSCRATGETLKAGTGALRDIVDTITSGEDETDLLVFLLSETEPDSATLACETIDIASFPCLLRLDEVSFPPGAVAYRHTHPGPGFRFLRHGALHLQADDHSFEAVPGQAWFEPADAPVHATAAKTHAETRFVRFMVLPPDYAGRPTINILAPDDAEMPRRQTTSRHLDHVLKAWPQVYDGG